MVHIEGESPIDVSHELISKIFKEIIINNIDIEDNYFEENLMELTSAYLMNVITLLPDHWEDEMKMEWVKETCKALCLMDEITMIN